MATPLGRISHTAEKIIGRFRKPDVIFFHPEHSEKITAAMEKYKPEFVLHDRKEEEIPLLANDANSRPEKLFSKVTLGEIAGRGSNLLDDSAVAKEYKTLQKQMAARSEEYTENLRKIYQLEDEKPYEGMPLEVAEFLKKIGEPMERKKNQELQELLSRSQGKIPSTFEELMRTPVYQINPDALDLVVEKISEEAKKALDEKKREKSNRLLEITNHLNGFLPHHILHFGDRDYQHIARVYSEAHNRGIKISELAKGKPFDVAGSIAQAARQRKTSAPILVLIQPQTIRQIGSALLTVLNVEEKLHHRVE
ncbi:MAG: hypothetical protein WC408_00430 [Candidatus Micrarchaeia archaeon]|jgi:hypothetical protein